MESVLHRTAFLDKLTNFLREAGVAMKDPKGVNRRHIISEGKTWEDRQRLLERFFREVFSQVKTHLLCNVLFVQAKFPFNICFAL